MILSVTGCNGKGGAHPGSSHYPGNTQPAEPQPAEPQPAEPQPAELQPSNFNEKNAKKVTVYFSGYGNGGSGVIVGKDGEKYYVLTAKHVFHIRPGKNEVPYRITTHDGERYEVKYKNVEKANNADIALLEFISYKSYPIAKLAGYKILANQNVYVSGWIYCSPSIEESPQRIYEGNKGSVKIRPSPKRRDRDHYDVEYTNKTTKGMSGSPLFDQEGRVLAIHGGKPNKNKGHIPKPCEPSTPDSSGNLGVSIQTFLKSNIADGIEEKGINVVYSPPEQSQVTPDPDNSPESPIKNPTEIIEESFFKDGR